VGGGKEEGEDEEGRQTSGEGDGEGYLRGSEMVRIVEDRSGLDNNSRCDRIRRNKRREGPGADQRGSEVAGASQGRVIGRRRRIPLLLVGTQVHGPKGWHALRRPPLLARRIARRAQAIVPLPREDLSSGCPPVERGGQQQQDRAQVHGNCTGVEGTGRPNVA
jgi:hypothetical protein